MSLKRVQYHLVHLRDITCANGEDDITMMGTHHHHLRRGVHVFHPTDPILGRRVVELKSLIHNGVRADRRIILLLFTSSALANASANASAKNLVRENKCGWKITRIADCGYLRRAASSKAEISVG